MTEAVVPLTVIAGYLGAGKTTVLNHLITNAGGRRLAVLVNDFGELNIDADLIADHDGDTYALTNGCVCCTIGDDLGSLLQSIASDPNPPDEVYLEASGVTDGARFAALLTDWHGLAARGAIVVVDAEAIRGQTDDRFVGDMVERQLRAADLLVVNKVDLVDEAHLDRLAGWFESIGAGAPVVHVSDGRVPVDLVFGDGLGGGTVERPDERPDERTAVSDADTAVVVATGAADAAASHLAAMSSELVRDDVPWNVDALREVLDELAGSGEFGGVARIKGLVSTTAGRFALQMVGRRWRLDPVERPGDDVGGATELVVISVGVDAQSIAEFLSGRARSVPAA